MDRDVERAPGRNRERDAVRRAERWLGLLHKAAVTALALASLWLMLR